MPSRTFVGLATVVVVVVATAVAAGRGESSRRMTLTPEPHRMAAANVLVVESRSAVTALEEQVVAGSTKERGPSAGCRSDEARRLATIDATAADLRRVALEDEDELRSRTVLATLDDVLGPLCRCVGCSQPKEGCAAAARALSRLERVLSVERPTIEGVR